MEIWIQQQKDANVHKVQIVKSKSRLHLKSSLMFYLATLDQQVFAIVTIDQSVLTLEY